MSNPASDSIPSRPPRALTPTVLRRSWFEPHVRFFWVLGLVFFGTAVWLGITGWNVYRADKELISNGVLVDALVGGIPGHQHPPDSDFDLTFTLSGTSYQVSGPLEGRTDYVTQGKTVPIRVDPADPTRWTYRSEVPPLSLQMVAVVLAMMATVGAVLVAWLERRRVLRAYRQGEAWMASVVETGPSAIAPMSKQARCMPVDGRDKKLFSMIVPPDSAGAIRKGDSLWLCTAGRRSGRIVLLSIVRGNETE